MLRRVVLTFLCGAVLSGCSAVFVSRQDCAASPEEALAGLFAALQSTDAISADIEKPPMNLREILDFKKIMRVAPDPQKLLASLGGGDPQKGWQELRFLRGLILFYGTSGLEFQEYIMHIESTVPLSRVEVGKAAYEVLLRRTDILLDMTGDRNFKEVNKRYSRTFVAAFTEGGFCITGLTPVGEWAELRSD